MDRERIMDDITFEEFVMKYEGKIRDVADLLSKPFGDNIPILEEQISTVCTRMEFISWCFAMSGAFLMNARATKLTAKGEASEKERQIRVDDACKREEFVRDWLENMNKNIDRYVSNAQSVLATKRMEISKLGYGGET